MSIDGNSEKKMVPKFSLQMFIQELHNSMVIKPEEGGLKEARYKENNFIISDSTLRNILPTQLKNMSARYKVMRGCDYCIYAKSMH